MSKIILSFATLGQGGAARVCAHLSRPLCDTFDEVILVTWADWPQFFDYDNRAKWYCVVKEAGSNNDFPRLRWFRSLVKREKPDLILSFLEPFNLRVLLCTIGLDVKIVVAERNDPRSVNKYWIMNYMEKLIYRRAERILVQTETVKSFFDGVLRDKTHIIFNPVNLTSEMVGKALLTRKKKRIVSVARLMPQKNHDVLIRAFARFAESHTDYTLTIYGDGPLKYQLVSLAESLNVGDKVFLPGASKTIHDDIIDAEMMCLVSDREGMSNAMIEAMCLGIPCICTKVSGAVDLINDGVNGLLVDIKDEKGLLKKMEYLAYNKDISDKIGRNATKLYQLLNEEKIYLEWMNFLKQLIN